MQFSFEALDGARNARRSLLEKIRSLADKAGSAGGTEAFEGKAREYQRAFDTALDEDLSTPKALASLWTLLRDPGLPPRDALAAAFDMDRVLGLGLEKGIEEQAEEDPEERREIEARITERKEAKKRKDFAAADKIREALKGRGIVLEDGPAGTLWRRG
jgi:cysteinyl-tRNA synthetase